MAGFTASEIIDRSPEAVFEFSTNTENAPKWLTKIVRIEPLTDGPMRVGSKFRETRMMGKRECSAVIEVVEHEGPGDGDGNGPPYRHAARSAAMGVDARYRYTYSPEGEDRTRVDLEAIVKPTSFLGRLMIPLMVKAMQKEDGDQLARLKQAIETGGDS